MSKEEFSEFKANEGWEEEEDEEEEEKIVHYFSVEGLPGLKASWRRLIHQAACLTLSSYTDDVDRDRALLEDQAALWALSSRQQRALHVRYGQKSILYRLLELSQC